jgi:hypothetical protein
MLEVFGHIFDDEALDWPFDLAEVAVLEIAECWLPTLDAGVLAVPVLTR